MSATVSSPARGTAASAARKLPGWWPLAALIVLAALLRFATLDLQSFWYDEAFTPVHVLHASLWATLRSVVHTENSPPLWYLIAWADARVLGTGEVALRLPSALAGLATVPVAWAIGRELAGRRTALACAALVAVNPLLVWYSQEARVYSLFVLTAALALLCFLRALREPTRGRMALFALSGALALLSHYFAVFVLVPMALWLVFAPGPRRAATRRAALPAIAALTVVGLALLPLISAQGGHGTQWIGEWALSARLQAIPQYYLTGYSGEPLGRAIELLVALPILAGAGLGLWCMLAAPARPGQLDGSGENDWDDGDEAARGPRGALIALSIAAAGVLTPVVLVAFGADYLAPRNLVAAMIPVTRADRRAARRAALARAQLERRRRAARVLPGADVSGVPRDLARCRSQSAPAARKLARRRRGAARRQPARVRSRASSSAPRRWSTTCRGCTTCIPAARCSSAKSMRPATRRCVHPPASRPRPAFICARG